ncbi:MAG: hypothetical protein ACXVEF_43760 [Polyangiales bacterium]
MGAPYRVPAEAGPEPDPEAFAPATWRRTSSRVLGALAALTEARGASDTAETLSDRAKRAREEEPEVRQLPRSNHAFVALERGDLETARLQLAAWVEDATVLAAASRDRSEAHLGLAAIASLQGFHVEVDGHLRAAFALGLPKSRSLALPIALVTANALLTLDRPELAATLLAGRREKHGTLQRLRAALALAHDELARAQIHAGEALELQANRPAEVAETRVLVARIHLRAGRPAAAERSLAHALDTFEALSPRNVLGEAEALAHVATFFAARKDFPRARKALENGARLLSVVGAPCLAILPFLTLGARILHAGGENDLASAWDGSIAHVRAWAPPSR